MKQDYICAGALTEESLTGAVSDFLYRVRPHRERLWDYYEGQQPVPKGEAVRGARYFMSAPQVTGLIFFPLMMRWTHSM